MKDLFDKAVRKPFVALAATLSTAFTPALAIPAGKAPDLPKPTATLPPEEPEYTYWKHPDYDLVAKVWECNENKLCAEVDSVDSKDPDNRVLMARLKGYATEETRVVGRGQKITVWKPAPQFVEDWEIEAYVGFRPDIDVTKKREGKWKGRVTSPFNNESYGLDIEKKGENELKLSGYYPSFPIFKLSMTVERVPDPHKPLPPEPSSIF